MQTVKQSMTSGAENPDFIRSAVGERTPSSSSFKLWSMGDIQNARLSTRLTDSGQVRVALPQSNQIAVFITTFFLICMILSKSMGIPFVKSRARFSCRFLGTIKRTVAFIWLQSRKLFATLPTKSSGRDRNFSTSSPSHSLSASMRTVTMPRSFRVKRHSALVTMFDALFTHRRIINDVA